jgi:hypothetical protein
MRGILPIVLLVLILVGAALVTAPRVGFLGVGSFDQKVIVDADKPIRRVTSCCCRVNEEIRHQAERTADPRLFECEEAEQLPGNRFSARVTFVTRSGLFRGDKVCYPAQLVVYTEFADGTRACRVVDMPAGRGGEPVVVRFR